MSKISRYFLGIASLVSIFLALYFLQPQSAPLISEAASSQIKALPLVVVEHKTLPLQEVLAETAVAPIPPARKPTLQTTKPKSAAAPASKPEVTPSATCSGNTTQQFMCLLNQYRASHGLGKVSYNNGLAKVALGHSQWMQETGIFSHTGVNGSRLGERCRSAGITCRGENLAKGAKSPQHLLEMWKASPGHNAILLGKYTTMGMGIVSKYTTLLMN